MATIFDLIIKDSDMVDIPLSPDPVHEKDVLIEATLLSILATMLNDSVALLFDLRTSLFLDQGNTGVLVARKVSEASISNYYRTQPYHVWVSGISSIAIVDELCSINIDNRIYIKSQSLDFCTGNVEGIGEVAVSFDDGLEAYLKTIPNWNSEFTITGFSRFASKLP